MAFEFNILHKTPIVNDLVHAAQTVNDDPGNYKKKALLSGALTTGMGTYGLYKLHKEFPKVTGKQSMLRALTALAFPAGIYYAVTHNNSNKDIAIGAGTSIGGLALRHKLNLSPTIENMDITNIPLKTHARTAAPLLGATLTGTYMFNQLQNAKKLEQRKFINS